MTRCGTVICDRWYPWARSAERADLGMKKGIIDFIGCMLAVVGGVIAAGMFCTLVLGRTFDWASVIIWGTIPGTAAVLWSVWRRGSSNS